jgi:hypothetical protein
MGMQEMVVIHSALDDDDDGDIQCVNVFVDSVLSGLFGIREWYQEEPRKINQD